MKVLLSAFACAPNKGGEVSLGWNWGYYYATMLNYEVWCITLPRHKEFIEAERANIPPNLHIIYVPSPEWVDRYVPNDQIRMYVRYMAWQEKVARVAKEMDKEINFDFLHHVTYASLQLSTALWKLNKPLIFGPVGGGQIPPPTFKKYFLNKWRMEVNRSWASSVLLKLNSNVRKTMKKAALVLVTNQETYDMAKQSGATKLKLFLDTSLPEAYYPTVFPERAPSEVLRIVWVGGLLARKALVLVLEALSKVNPRVPFMLTVLGDGVFRDYLEKWVANSNLKGKVQFEGKQPWQVVREAYLTSDVFIFCSLRDSFGSQVLEAMACGLPVIGLDHQGVRDFVPQNAGIKVAVTVPEETVEGVARAIEYMYDHPEQRVEFAKKGYEFAKTQNWPAKVNTLMEYYQESQKALV